MKIEQRFFLALFIMIAFMSFCSFLAWKLLIIEKKIKVVEQKKEQDGVALCEYEEIDLIMPVQALLKRCSNSEKLSIVRRLFVNNWIYLHQSDLISLIAYGQGATTFEELKKALLVGIEKSEKEKSSAASFVMSSLKTIEKDYELIKHVDSSLIEGFSAKIHELRGRMRQIDSTTKEYKKLKIEYRKQLEVWIDEKHGSLLDDIIATI